MLSPLEHEPDLISGIGLITVRWAALEAKLAEALGQLFKVAYAGPATYYSLGNFSQRIDILEALINASVQSRKHQEIAAGLFLKIRRLWKTRNYLVHSHYAYVLRYRDGSQVALTGLGPESEGRHPKEMGASLWVGRPDGSPLFDTIDIAERGFAYESHKDGKSQYVYVNKGTFQNHADQLAKRHRQATVLIRAFNSGRAPLLPNSESLLEKLGSSLGLDLI